MDEQIQAHVVSVWREPKKLLALHGREGMLVLTNRRLGFIHRTESKARWWEAVVGRQALGLLRDPGLMNVHDGYGTAEFSQDAENEKNAVIGFGDIADIGHAEKAWGSVMTMSYEKDGRAEKHDYSIVRDWVKYPVKAPTSYMKADWEPFVRYVRDRQGARP